MTQLDRLSIDILHELQADARLPNAQLAELVETSSSSCWRKVKALEEDGVILRYAAIVDPRKMGRNFEAIVHLHLDRHDAEGVEQLTELLMTCDEVIECFATTGDFDYHIRVLCADIESYNEFLESILFRNSSIKSTKTNVVLKQVKSNAPIRGVTTHL